MAPTKKPAGEGTLIVLNTNDRAPLDKGDAVALTIAMRRAGPAVAMIQVSSRRRGTWVCSMACWAASSAQAWSPVVSGILEKHGGLQGVVNEFERNGFGATVNSWVGTGQNQPISPADVEKALGPDLLQQLSQKSGLSVQDLSQRLSHVLPEAMDKLTPEGVIRSRSRCAKNSRSCPWRIVSRAAKTPDRRVTAVIQRGSQQAGHTLAIIRSSWDLSSPMNSRKSQSTISTPAADQNCAAVVSGCHITAQVFIARRLPADQRTTR